MAWLAWDQPMAWLTWDQPTACELGSTLGCGPAVVRTHPVPWPDHILLEWDNRPSSIAHQPLPFQHCQSTPSLPALLINPTQPLPIQLPCFSHLPLYQASSAPAESSLPRQPPRPLASPSRIIPAQAGCTSDRTTPLSRSKPAGVSPVPPPPSVQAGCTAGPLRRPPSLPLRALASALRACARGVRTCCRGSSRPSRGPPASACAKQAESKQRVSKKYGHPASACP